jgi:hypothetical protein
VLNGISAAYREEVGPNRGLILTTLPELFFPKHHEWNGAKPGPKESNTNEYRIRGQHRGEREAGLLFEGDHCEKCFQKIATPHIHTAIALEKITPAHTLPPDLERDSSVDNSAFRLSL